jgi:hypothetical protein
LHILGPPKYPPPVFDGRELRVHPHRVRGGVTPTERELVFCAAM